MPEHEPLTDAEVADLKLTIRLGAATQHWPKGNELFSRLLADHKRLQERLDDLERILGSDDDYLAAAKDRIERLQRENAELISDNRTKASELVELRKLEANHTADYLEAEKRGYDMATEEQAATIEQLKNESMADKRRREMKEALAKTVPIEPKHEPDCPCNVCADDPHPDHE